LGGGGPGTDAADPRIHEDGLRRGHQSIADRGGDADEADRRRFLTGISLTSAAGHVRPRRARTAEEPPLMAKPQETIADGTNRRFLKGGIRCRDRRLDASF
jgi:hypothetical protein